MGGGSMPTGALDDLPHLGNRRLDRFGEEKLDAVEELPLATALERVLEVELEGRLGLAVLQDKVIGIWVWV